MKVLTFTKTLLKLSLVAFAVSGWSTFVYAEGRPATTPGAAFAHSLSVMRNGPSIFKARILTRHHVYYVGDTMEISLVFARGSDLLTAGTADAHVVVYSAGGTLIDIPVVPPAAGTTTAPLVKIDHVDLTALAAGQYQLGLIVTAPGGDPASLADWYSGFRALLDTQAIIVSATKPANGDLDGDGELDDDTDGHGIDNVNDDAAAPATP